MATTAQKNTKKTNTAVAQTRVRLLPEVRRRQILDAALIEFSALGFTAASIAKIAERAGTSKANLYVHFANKDEIFETLLKELLVPSKGTWQPEMKEGDIGELIDTFIEQMYDGLTPQTVAVIRLVISESHRVPALIQRWHEKAVMPARAEQQRRINQYVAQGKLAGSALTDYFSFAMVPVLTAAVVKMVFGQEMADSECLKIKETHRKALHMLLRPQSEQQ